MSDFTAMAGLFEIDALFATVHGKGLLDADATCSIQDGDGKVVAQARDRAGAVRWFVRLFGNARASRFEWDLLDGDGNRVLDIAKPKARMGGVSPEVSSADGTPLGRCVPTGRLKAFPPVAFQGPNGTALGELAPALGERRASPILMYRILAADTTEVGEIAHQTEGPWGFHLTFRPDAGLPVRALSIAYTICLVQQRTTN